MYCVHCLLESVLRVALRNFDKAIEGRRLFSLVRDYRWRLRIEETISPPTSASVTDEGVAHVMSVFERHFIDNTPEKAAIRLALQLLHTSSADQADPEARSVAEMLKLMCDEEALDIDPATGRRASGN